MPDMNPGKTLALIQKKAMKKGSARSPKARNLIRRSQITDHRSGSILDQPAAFGHRSAGNAKGQIGFPQTVEGAILQNGRIAEIHGVGDVAEDDVEVAQAGGDAAMGVVAIGKLG